MTTLPLLSILTALPVAGALTVLLIGAGCSIRARWTAFSFSLLSLALTVTLWCRFDSPFGAMQFVEKATWLPSLGIEYHLGVDGLGLLMVLLAAILTPMAILASSKVTERAALYFALMLLLESGLFGAFTALNFFHWFLFWELSLIPAFFLIRLWGGPRRAAASTMFFVYTMVGSVTLLLSFLALYLATKSFDFVALANMAQQHQLIPALAAHFGGANFGGATPERILLLLFWGAFLGFAVKVPLMPFHTWQPETYAEAPSGVTMMLTGAMSKMGVYGFLRILLPIFGEPMQWMRTPLLVLAVATIVLAPFAALVQKDLKRAFAYSSMSHLGYCLLGIFAIAAPFGTVADKSSTLAGILLQMFNHGLTAATLFWFVAMIEQRSGGLRGVNDFGGLRKPAPVFCGLMGIALFSSLGLPGLNGFVGEFLLFKGFFPLAPWASSLSLIALLTTAILLLTILQRVFTGPVSLRWNKWPDLTLGERVALGSPIALMFVLGVWPQLLLGPLSGTIAGMASKLAF
jgi:NADH-quinone oxidoreductase subunit M